jgi:uncharacterized protein
MTSASLSPVAGEERLVHLDVLRAIALFGVLMVNLLTEFRVSIFTQFFGPADGSSLDRGIDRVVSIGIESKAFILFSLLFGVGLAIQLDRAERRGRAFLPHAARRLGALLAIGLVHLVLVWNGDILAEYAVAGFVALAFLRAPRRVLFLIALVALVVFVAPLPYPAPFASDEAMTAHVAEASRVYAHGTLAEVQAFRVHELPPILALDFGALPRTIGLFALGMWAWRAGIVTRPRDHVRLLAGAAILGIAVGMIGTLGASIARSWETVVAEASAIVLGLGYGAAILLLYQQRSMRRALTLLAPLGRMALTNYLAQSILFGLVFYGYGLGQLGAMSVTRGAILGVVVYAGQAVASAWWLAHFQFGPVEWLWRSATYRAWQPMRRRPASRAMAST